MGACVSVGTTIKVPMSRDCFLRYKVTISLRLEVLIYIHESTVWNGEPKSRHGPTHVHPPDGDRIFEYICCCPTAVLKFKGLCVRVCACM